MWRIQADVSNSPCKVKISQGHGCRLMEARQTFQSDEIAKWNSAEDKRKMKTKHECAHKQRMINRKKIINEGETHMSVRNVRTNDAQKRPQWKEKWLNNWQTWVPTQYHHQPAYAGWRDNLSKMEWVGHEKRARDPIRIGDDHSRKKEKSWNTIGEIFVIELRIGNGNKIKNVSMKMKLDGMQFRDDSTNVQLE